MLRLGKNPGTEAQDWWRQQFSDFEPWHVKILGQTWWLLPIEELIGLSGSFCNEQSNYLLGQDGPRRTEKP